MKYTYTQLDKETSRVSWEADEARENHNESRARFLEGKAAGYEDVLETIKTLETTLTKIAIQHHSAMNHEGFFEKCLYLNCQMARKALSLEQATA